MCILNISSPVPHTCEVIHKCHSFPFPAARGLLFRSCSALRPCWALGSASTTWLQGWFVSSRPEPPAPDSRNSPQRAPGTWSSSTGEAPARESVCTPTTKRVLSRPNPAVSSKDGPELSHKGSTQAPGSPSHTFVWTRPSSLALLDFNHMQKNVNGSAWNKGLSPWRCSAWHSSQGVNQLAGEHKWERLFLKREKLAGPECWPPAPSPKWFHFWLP